VCRECFNFTRGFDRCYACASGERHLSALLPISYSLGCGHLHHVLSDYKRETGLPAARAVNELAAILTRFLVEHEDCLAGTAGVERFDVVTTVPAGDRARDDWHPLRLLVERRVPPVRSRFERLLVRSPVTVPARRFDPRRFEVTRRLDGLRVLLIDDTWTTGASAQSAAAALREAGAVAVGAVVAGRHLRRGWQDNDERIRRGAGAFDWSRCAFCAGSPERETNPTVIRPEEVLTRAA
jgi:predicted amidophosphoribosyltransferase